MKKNFLFIIPLLIIVSYFLFFSDITDNSVERQPLDSRMAVVELYINAGRIDSAYTLLQTVINDTPDQLTYDSALSLQLQIQKIVLLDIPGKHTDALLELNSSEYELLQKNQLEKQFLSNPVLNEYYLNKLQQNTEYTEVISKEQQKPDAEVRRSYASKLLKSYTDLGFEISINVSGASNERLTLISPVFDDDWFSKFEKGGDLDAWHTIGFEYIQIENGSGYVRSKKWTK